MSIDDKVFSGSTKDTFHHQSADVSHKHFEKLYQISLQNCVVQWLAKIHEKFNELE